MVNDGKNEGSSFYGNYSILERHGAATWADFPYDANYTAWCLNGAAWRSALGVRTRTTAYVYDASTDLGLEQSFEVESIREPALAGAPPAEVAKFHLELAELQRAIEGADSTIEETKTRRF